MTWDLDDRFKMKENESILAFIRDKNPSVHSDISDLLTRSAEDLPVLPEQVAVRLYDAAHV